MSQNILVTGTNSGFGQLTAQTLADRGHHVFATMRDIRGRNADNAAALEDYGCGRIRVVQMALTDDVAVETAVQDVLDMAGHIDVVVNNAGYAVMGLEETLTSTQLLEQYDVNVVGPHRVMRAVLPSMRRRRHGLIIQISSSLGRTVTPVMGAYCSSKFALEALSEAYRYSLKPVGVEVSMVQPGAFPTDLGSRVVVGRDQDRAADYGYMADAMSKLEQGFKALFASGNAPDPKDVARAVLELVESPAGTRPARVVVDPLSGKLTETVNRTHAQVQREALGFFGMEMLAD